MKGLIVQPASFDKAMDLKDALGKALMGHPLGLSGLRDTEGDGEDFVEGLDLDKLATAALSVITDKPLRSALFDCMERVTFENVRVDREFFSVPENWQHYYPIALEVIKVNVGPFFGSLTGLFSKVENLMRSKLPGSK